MNFLSLSCLISINTSIYFQLHITYYQLHFKYHTSARATKLLSNFLQNFEKERSELEKRLVENEENEETKESMQFYTDNISGLNSELSSLKSK